ncbi:hypothetical protein F5Y16DRAFT_372492 [Xylariaceae sp. FL0255]|nr:hypothetical protein F5Y16DRAFT_372492 [Xylariaceae sp. FL0255]
MHPPNALLALPPALLLLIAAQLSTAIAQLDTAIQLENRHNALLLPTAVRMLSPDEGEKFMPEDFAFAPDSALLLTSRANNPFLEPSYLTPEEEALLAANSSAALLLRPPFPIHQTFLDGSSSNTALEEEIGRREQEQTRRSLFHRAREALSRLQRRDFTCPTGTHACTTIGEPNYCCPDGTTCFTVPDAPMSGNVGCCPDGQTCGDSVGACPSGSMQCTVSQGGGCCIAGFVCTNSGCVVSQSVITSTTTSTTSITYPTPTISVVTVTVVITPSNSPEPTTSTQTITQTASTSSSSSSSSSGGGLPPDRATSSSPNPTTTTTTNPTTTSPSTSYCPTGFYGCLATAGSGCCRTGRDCSTTSCPPIASTTIVETDGMTIVVPASDAASYTATSTVGSCATGWFLCGTGAAAGTVAGCCPSGYVCGTASCTLSAATATVTVQKELPGLGVRVGGESAGRLIWGVLLGVVVALIGGVGGQ